MVSESRLKAQWLKNGMTGLPQPSQERLRLSDAALHGIVAGMHQDVSGQGDGVMTVVRIGDANDLQDDSWWVSDRSRGWGSLNWR